MDSLRAEAEETEESEGQPGEREAPAAQPVKLPEPGTQGEPLRPDRPSLFGPDPPAQSASRDMRPGEPGPTPEAEDPFELPAISLLGLPGLDGSRSSLAIPVTGFSFEGNTVYTDEELSDVLGSFLEKKALTGEDLESARVRLTEFYVRGGNLHEDLSEPPPPEDGYVTSGALLPDQDPSGGVVRFEIVEGELTEVRINWFPAGDAAGGDPVRGLLRDHYVAPRVHLGAGPPVHMRNLRDQLQRLQRNPNVGRINAELKPGAEPGESYIELNIEKGDPLSMGVDFMNDRPPSVGEEQIELWATHTSITGMSDVLSIQYGVLDGGFDETSSSGLDNFFVFYAIPFTRRDTAIEVSYESNSYAIIEEPFADLEIEGESKVFRAGVRQPLVQTEKNEFALGLYLEHDWSQTELFGVPFSITPGAVDGEIELSALQFTQEWVNRSRQHVFAARSSFNAGTDVFGATENGTDRDSDFYSWTGQAQYVHRFEVDRSAVEEEGEPYTFEVIVRGTMQLSSDPLLSPQQFTIGGVSSVRGYRENLLVRDEGYQATLEGRFPLFGDSESRTRLSFAPFVDVGGGRNSVMAGIDDERINVVGAGAGLLLRLFGRLDAVIYWGHAFTDFDFADQSLQDHGVHFRLSWQSK